MPPASGIDTAGSRQVCVDGIVDVRAVDLLDGTARQDHPTGPGKPDQPYEIRLRQAGELREGAGATRISIDAGDASVLRVIDPEQARGGNRLLSWMFPLHTGEAFGLAGRIFISLFGMVPLVFFITGLVVWVKLRKKESGLPRRPRWLQTQ